MDLNPDAESGEDQVAPSFWIKLQFYSPTEQFKGKGNEDIWSNEYRYIKENEKIQNVLFEIYASKQERLLHFFLYSC